MSIAKRNGHNETGTFAQLAFHPYVSMMQLYDTFRQGKANACARRLAGILNIDRIYLIETVENLIHFFGIDTFSCIRNTNNGILFVTRNRQGDGIFGFGMLHRIGQQVIDNLLHLFLIIPNIQCFHFLLEIEMDLMCTGILQKQQIVFIKEAHNIVGSHSDLHVSLFLFSEIEQFCYQLPKLNTVFIDAQHFIIKSRSKILYLKQRLYLRNNKSKGRTELM